MPGLGELQKEAREQATQKNPNGAVLHLVKKKRDYLKDLSKKTGRNTILYFSAFLQKPEYRDTIIGDRDLNLLMGVVHKLDKSKGLDLVLHTPGGDVSATEQIIKYLRSMFNGNIRAIIPQMAMSAGSMIAVSCKSILMGKQSCLGPFDPQLNNVPCQSVIKEFYRAVDDVNRNPSSLGLWQTIISKLNPTFLTLCEQADLLTQELTDEILLASDYTSDVKQKIKDTFCDNTDSKSHSRHIDIDRCKKAGLHIVDLEADQEIQDLVLSIHHCCMLLGDMSTLIKCVENSEGKEFTLHIPMQNTNNTHPLMLK